MSHETVGDKGFYATFMEVANVERAQLELNRGQAEGLEGLTERTKIILESRGRACLKTNYNVGGAVRLLALADALEKPDVIAMLTAQFERLDRSDAERDQGTLVELCENLASAKPGGEYAR